MDLRVCSTIKDWERPSGYTSSSILLSGGSPVISREHSVAEIGRHNLTGLSGCSDRRRDGSKVETTGKSQHRGDHRLCLLSPEISSLPCHDRDRAIAGWPLMLRWSRDRRGSLTCASPLLPVRGWQRRRGIARATDCARSRTDVDCRSTRIDASRGRGWWRTRSYADGVRETRGLASQPHDGSEATGFLPRASAPPPSWSVGGRLEGWLVARLLVLALIRRRRPKNNHGAMIGFRSFLSAVHPFHRSMTSNGLSAARDHDLM